MMVRPTPEINPPITGVEMYFAIRPALSRKKTRNHRAVQDRNQRHQLHGGIGFCRDAKARQQTAHHDGGHCIHAYHELRRGGKQTKGQNGQQGAIQTIDSGQPRNLCVAHEMGWIPAQR